MSFIRNQAVTGLPDPSYRMRASEGKRWGEEGGLFSGTGGIGRPPRYEHVFFLKFAFWKLRAGSNETLPSGHR